MTETPPRRPAGAHGERSAIERIRGHGWVVFRLPPIAWNTLRPRYPVLAIAAGCLVLSVSAVSLYANYLRLRSRRP